MKNQKDRSCDCAICQHEHDFVLPDDLAADIFGGNVVIFAGAGVSTEKAIVYKFSLHDQIAAELNVRSSKYAFPDLMELYCRQQGGRLKLLQIIKRRLESVDSFDELRRQATRFHEVLATMFFLSTIITTNWDTYFEECCNATPFVTDSDLAFWAGSDRKVLKIHGSITNYGTMVATKEDYRKCEKALRSGLIGGVLTSILSTQTLIFIGTSLSDPDFMNIYKHVKQKMNNTHRQAYIVTPFAEDGDRFKEMGLVPIITDATYFLSELKKHAVSEGIMLPDSIYLDALRQLMIVQNEHDKLQEEINIEDHPQMIYAAAYQDGLIHSLERIVRFRTSGEYSNAQRNIHVARLYESWRKEKLRSRIYEDVAYIDGYVNALLLPLLSDDERNSIPLYFAFGTTDDILTFKDYRKILPELPTLHKASLERAKRYLRKVSYPAETIFHHPPWL